MPFTSTFYTDQQIVTASAVALAAAGQLGTGAVIRASPSNAGKVFLGGSNVTTTDDGTGNGFALEAGASVELPLNLIDGLFVRGTLNDIIYVIGA